MFEKVKEFFEKHKDNKKLDIIFLGAIVYLFGRIFPLLFYDILIWDDVTRGEFLGYYGAMIGGLFTMVGIAWTIQHEKKIRREDLALQYRPYVAIGKSCNVFYSSIPQAIIKIKNTGKGEACNIKIKYCNKLNEYSEVDITKQLLRQDEEYEVNLNFSVSQTHFTDLVFTVEISYTDLFSVFNIITKEVFLIEEKADETSKKKRFEVTTTYSDTTINKQ